eukprot:TRINITY_DN26778_c0_g1_i1.p1 TRINITY_DN26778_c0_g1~~TRINITY_DN26778_c0_g1_i1.p1  ORF type:complete len:603 (+),score=126.60 TRINITY_DN26778_c0_g1_i1:247-1809(+)
MASRLLYLALQLQGSSTSLLNASNQCAEILRDGFHAACQGSVEMGLISRLPIDVLEPILQADELQVPSEGSVLKVVQRVLWRRMRREERILTISGARLCEAAVLLQEREAATEAVTWEATVLEETPALDGSVDIDSLKVAKCTATTSPSPLVESTSGEGVAIEDMTMRFPTGSLGPGRRGALLLRATSASEVLLIASLPAERLPQSPQSEESGEADEITAEAIRPDGQFAGTIRFRWNVSLAPPAPEDANQKEGGDPAEQSEQEGKVDKAVIPDLPLTEEEAKTILSAVRFPYLEHKDLLAAMKDPVLLEAGAQQQVLEALSSRLSHYEHTGEESSPAVKQPRPSTLPGAELTVNPVPKTSPRPPPAAADTAKMPTELAVVAQPLPNPDLVMAQTYHSGSGRAYAGAFPGAAGGLPLFPCSACEGRGRLQLRQQGMRWCVRCSRHASCQNVIWLPSCVMAAAIDGHCAACALRLGSEVRTLTIRVGRDHADALRKLPGGVDTLRGMCIAGCNDTLSLLGN